MEERRRNKRTQLESMVVIKRLDGGEDQKLSVQVNNLSKTGMGFLCDKLLNIGEVYEVYITIWTKEVIHAFLRISRIEMEGNIYNYGAVFVGMSETEASRIEIYQTIHEDN